MSTKANIHGSVAYSSKNNSLSPASSTAVCKLTTVTELAFSKNCVRATKSLVLSGISWTLSDISSQDLHSLQMQLQITLNQLLSLSLLFLTVNFPVFINQSIIPSTDVIQLALALKMTTAQVVQTSVTVNNYSPIQDYVHPDDQTQPTFYFLINLRLFQTLRQITNRWRRTKTITKFQVENCFICSMQENRLIFTCFYFVISTFWLSLCKPQIL